MAPNFYYGKRGQDPAELTELNNKPYPEWKVEGNITATIVGMLAIYANQFINILIIHIQLKKDYRIEIYGWTLFCARGKIKSQNAEVYEVVE